MYSWPDLFAESMCQGSTPGNRCALSPGELWVTRQMEPFQSLFLIHIESLTWEYEGREY